jgi:hypothetical protein
MVDLQQHARKYQTIQLSYQVADDRENQVAGVQQKHVQSAMVSAEPPGSSKSPLLARG